MRLKDEFLHPVQQLPRQSSVPTKKNRAPVDIWRVFLRHERYQWRDKCREVTEFRCRELKSCVYPVHTFVLPPFHNCSAGEQHISSRSFTCAARAMQWRQRHDHARREMTVPSLTCIWWYVICTKGPFYNTCSPAVIYFHQNPCGRLVPILNHSFPDFPPALCCLALFYRQGCQSTTCQLHLLSENLSESSALNASTPSSTLSD